MVTAKRGAIELPMPAPSSLVAHMLAEHQPCTRAILGCFTDVELATFHLAEHRHRDVPGDKRQPVHAGHLGHVHPAPKASPARRKAARS